MIGFVHNAQNTAHNAQHLMIPKQIVNHLNIRRLGMDKCTSLSLGVIIDNQPPKHNNITHIRLDNYWFETNKHKNNIRPIINHRCCNWWNFLPWEAMRRHANKGGSTRTGMDKSCSEYKIAFRPPICTINKKCIKYNNKSKFIQ